jgi:hypothetical protein
MNCNNTFILQRKRRTLLRFISYDNELEIKGMYLCDSYSIPCLEEVVVVVVVVEG